MICPNCQTELPPNARFCLNCGQPTRTITPSNQARYSRLAASAPTTLIEKVRAAARLTGERRTVTALYLDVVNSTGISQKLGETAWGKVLNKAFDLCSASIYHYEGTLTHVQDDELLAFFGAPVAHEDDPVRAVRAALDILAAIRQYDQQMQQAHGISFEVRLSLSTGPVTIGPVGSNLKYEYSALGGAVTQVVNLEAARVPMTVLVTEETYRFIQPFFDSTDLGLVKPVGFSYPVHIYQVDGLKAVQESGRGLVGLHSPMVGRQDELNTLQHLSQMVSARLGQVVVVHGEPGLGKTRLITEWRNSTQASPTLKGLHWVEGRCLSYGRQLAYHLVLSLLHGIVGVPDTAEEPETRAGLCNLIEELWQDPGFRPQAETVIEVYPFLANLLSLKLDSDTLEGLRQLDPQALQNQTLAALRKLLLALTSRQPLVIVLEDLHWADPSSVDFLTQLIPLATTERILFCLVMRSERDAPAWRLVTAGRESLGSRLTEITLSALSTSESRQLVSNLLAIEALPNQLRDLILKKAEGNPFFVEEVIRMLIDRGTIYSENGQWRSADHIGSLEIPDNLQGLLQARIDRLPEEIKHTLRVAAVIGRQFPVKVLEHVLSKEEHHERP